ncbi:type II toxin-antitoxin system ParD family antitoxin [Mesorhizobium sp. ASY16-5R]|uniref:type II toxin-antitoxin system ParD family antitoxin n=1 Tax=Mesorhizobium sp. ASY16-5R TaxID=3445772 RepID=UPI003FA06DB1
MAFSVELGETLEQVVTELVANGRYNSKSEVLREGVRLVQEREARLRTLHAAIECGIADADAGRVEDAEVFLDQLEQKYLRMAGV